MKYSNRKKLERLASEVDSVRIKVQTLVEALREEYNDLSEDAQEESSVWDEADRLEEAERELDTTMETLARVIEY